jgi:Ca2+-binding RTX toxin-like protein
MTDSRTNTTCLAGGQRAGRVPMRLARRAALATALTIAFAAPAAAHAATVAHDGDVLTVEAGPGENNLLELERLDNGFVRVKAVGPGGDVTVLTPDTCDPPDPTWKHVDCDPLSRVVTALGDGDDTVRVRHWPTQVDLGPGDDRIVPGDSADVIIGGEGRDEVDYGGEDPRGRRNTPVTVTLDGQPNDGASGEGDNVNPGIEIIKGTQAGDHLVGNEAAQELNGNGGNDVVDGAGGDDIVGGSDGDDVLYGGAGNDKLDGHADSDRIDAGPGTDQVRGDGYCNVFLCGGGPDEILVRDGQADSVSCGVGHDRVTADPQEAIQEDGFEVCEAVDLPSAGGPPPSAGGPPPQKARPDTTKRSDKSGRAGPSFRVNPVKLGRALRRGLDLKVTCPEGCRAAARIRVAASTARRFKLGPAPTTIGRGSLQRVQPGTTGTLRVSFTSAARKRLRRAAKLPVTVAVTYQIGSQAATQSRKVLLRR